MSDRNAHIPLLRFGAFVLDTLALALILIIPASIVSYTAVWMVGATKWINIVWYAALLVLVLGILLRDGWHGRSPGKRILGLRVVRRNGEPCGYVRSMVRNAPLLVPLWNLLEVILVAWGKTRTGDRIAGTAVTEE